MLDTLAPAERVAFVLHDMFGVPFEDIGAIVDQIEILQLSAEAMRRGLID